MISRLRRVAVAIAASMCVLGAGPGVALAASWSAQTPAVPPGSSSALFESVSCPTTSFCAAVGFSHSSTAVVPLAERWDGATWTIDDTPVAPGASQNILFGVSCATANACLAVGESTVGDVTQEGAATSLWAERWDGSAWTVETPATPPLSSHSSLRGVSCASATDCTAVGYYWSNDVELPLAEHWAGSRWTLEQVPSADLSELNGVACNSATVCTAVGNANVGYRGIAGVWTEQPGPGPDAPAGGLNGVSCPSPDACTAVGWYENTSNHALFAPSPGAERWNGINWTEQPTGDDRIGPMLRSVSCPTTSLCLAGGEGTVQRWRPSSGWTFDSVPVSGVWYGISCPKQNVCTAAGVEYTSGGAAPAVLRYS